MAVITSPDTSRRRIVAVGTWDGVHLGHRHLLDALGLEARRLGLTPAVVTFPTHPLATVRPERVPPQLCPVSLRLDRLQEGGAADCILLDFNERLRAMTAREFMEMLHRDYAVDAVMLGFNNSFGSDRLTDPAQYRAAAQGLGMTVTVAPEYRSDVAPSVCSSTIRRLVADGRVGEAACLLGRPFALSGKVEGGNRIGRTIGVPTANLHPAPGMAVPGNGVYACVATIDSSLRRWPAMVNVGLRPTVTAGQSGVTPVIEAHLIGFEGDLYGHLLALDFVSRLRQEMRFPSLEALAEQLAADRTAALAALDGRV